jgi:poly-gamma-glutamate synthesis protein (capsule biosynthesis protein)
MRSHLLIAIGLFVFNASAFATDDPLRFSKACDPGDTITIGAVGDVLLHGPLQKQGYNEGFDSMWSEIADYISAPQLMYANLEGPAAKGVAKGGKNAKDPGLVFDGNVYSGYPTFNYNPIIIKDLKDSGFDILSTANNHSMDRGVLGVDRTIEALEDYGMPFMGTRKNGADESTFYNITTQNGWKIGWIACAWGTNGIPDNKDQVLDCFDTGRVSKLIKNLKPVVDAVIVTPHWGDEYQLSPNSQQKKFGRQWLEDGAAAIIGAHPHVPQPWENYTTQDGRQGLILYSLGNFVSNQSAVAKQSSILLYVGLTKKNGQAWVNGVRYLPLYMNRAPYYNVASNALSKPNSAQKESLKLLKKMFGEERILEPGEQILTNAECY